MFRVLHGERFGYGCGILIPQVDLVHEAVFWVRQRALPTMGADTIHRIPKLSQVPPVHLLELEAEKAVFHGLPIPHSYMDRDVWVRFVTLSGEKLQTQLGLTAFAANVLAARWWIECESESDMIWLKLRA